MSVLAEKMISNLKVNYVTKSFVLNEQGNDQEKTTKVDEKDVEMKDAEVENVTN